MSATTLTEPVSAEVAPRPPRPVHIIPLRADGTPSDTALCGYLWDRFYPHGAPAHMPRCEECLELARAWVGR